jgi:hypothetical protein
MKAKEKAWQLYSNFFDILEMDGQQGNIIMTHCKAINLALSCVDEVLQHASSDVCKDFENTGEFYSVSSYYNHVKNEILKLNSHAPKAVNAV